MADKKKLLSPFLANEATHIQVRCNAPGQIFLALHQISDIGVHRTMFLEMTDDQVIDAIEALMLAVEHSQLAARNVAACL